MGSIIGRAAMRTRTTAALVLLGVLAAVCLAYAAPPELTERDLSPPAAPEKARPGPRAYQLRVLETPSEEDQSPAAEDQAPAADEGAPPAEAAPRTRRTEPSAAAAPGGDLYYVIHEGDSIGAVAAMFHLPTPDLLRYNRLREGTMLHVGQEIRIPNPYSGQVRQLQAALAQVNAQNLALSRKLEEVGPRQQTLEAKITDLTSAKRALEHDVAVLPWWRRATTLAATAAIIMVGITLMSLVQWLLVRWRFTTVAEANERLSLLDQRYRILLAKAELRYQQLYGRRRAVAPDTTGHSKTPEEFEVERLNRELKEVLEHQIAQFGGRPLAPARRSRLREWLASLGSPVAARSGRR